MKFSEIREQISIQSGNQKIFGVLHRPMELSHFPALLICHGLGGNKIGKFRLYVKLAQRLANEGIASLRFDFRGSGDSEGRFSEMTIEGATSDALLALDYLRNHPQVDLNRIAIFGRSFGGAIAVLAASQNQQKLKSLSLWAPVFSGEQWSKYWQMLQSNQLTNQQIEQMMTINGFKLSLNLVEQLVSLNLSDSLASLKETPLLHIQGLKDATVTPEQASHFKKVRLTAEAETKFILLPNTDHDFSDTQERYEALGINIHWLQKTL